MKLFSKAPDGGKHSGVTGFFLIEAKSAFSIVLLRFNVGTREAFHSHAFNAVTLWLWGRVWEHRIVRYCNCGRSFCSGVIAETREFSAGDIKRTPRDCLHKIEALTPAWALSFRGPWLDYWQEWCNGRVVTLTHGRREVS